MDLPAPFSPTSACASPAWRSIVPSVTARTAPNDFAAWCRARTAVAGRAPEAPDALRPSSEASGALALSGTPGVSGVPAPSGTPGVSGVPAPSGIPGVSGVPTPSGIPEASGVPLPSGSPEISDVLGPSGTPGALDVPAPSGTLGISGTPAPSDTPGTSGAPETRGSGGGVPAGGVPPSRPSPAVTARSPLVSGWGRPGPAAGQRGLPDEGCAITFQSMWKQCRAKRPPCQ